jgi:CRISPR-associated protein Cmr2
MFGNALSEEMSGEEITTEEKILKKIKTVFHPDYQTSHKYIAIVKADGDNVGKLLKRIAQQEEKELTKFSENIFDFSRTASELIHQYGGKPVYIGGDDLVFFAPVVSHKKNEQNQLENENINWSENNTGNIFNLISMLDNAFTRIWKPWIDNEKYKDLKPSLSYGISVTYYKYPLNEAMKLSDDLLSAAKNNPGKNSIAVQLMTHSGSFDKALLNKDEKSTFDSLINLLDKFVEKDRETIVASVLQRLRNDAALILTIAEDDENADFKAYFHNEYDYKLIKDKNKRDYIDESVKLFDKIFRENKDKQEALEQLCTIYRLLNFLIHKEK